MASEGEASLVNDPPQGVSIQNIIQSFAAKEKEFKQALEQYTYTQDVTVRASCQGGRPGVYHLTVEAMFDKKREPVGQGQSSGLHTGVYRDHEGRP